jgi:hypothetical protein
MVQEAQLLMDRKLYLELCQKVSVLKNGILGIKENVPDDLKVICKGVTYYPVSYELSFDNGQPTHTAILHALRANSITKCNLERVKQYEQERSNLAD